MLSYLQAPRFPKMPISLGPPAFITKFLAKLPLVELPEEDSPNATELPSIPVIWIHANDSESGEGPYAWASYHPDSLRLQLLFLLRSVPVTFKPWAYAVSAPGGTLPSLHLPSNELKATSEIRPWLDTEHPIQGPLAQYQGVPDQYSYEKGVSVAQVVLEVLLPAYLDSLPSSSSSWLTSFFARPQSFAAGLTTLIPAAITGDVRTVKHPVVADGGVEALRKVDGVVGESWALDAANPTPMDALLASHLYVLSQLDKDTPLRRSWESSEFDNLRAYVRRVMDYANRKVE